MPRRSTAQAERPLHQDAPRPCQSASVVYDCDLPGFGIRITAAGARSFVLNYVDRPQGAPD